MWRKRKISQIFQQIVFTIPSYDSTLHRVDVIPFVFFRFDILFYYLFSMDFSLWWRHHWTGNTVDWTGQNIMDSNVSYKIDSNYHFSLSKSIKGQMQLGVFHEIISLCHKVSYSFIYLEEYASHVTNRICPKLELWIYFLKNFLKG